MARTKRWAEYKVRVMLPAAARGVRTPRMTLAASSAAPMAARDVPIVRRMSRGVLECGAAIVSHHQDVVGRLESGPQISASLTASADSAGLHPDRFQAAQGTQRKD